MNFTSSLPVSCDFSATLSKRQNRVPELGSVTRSHVTILQVLRSFPLYQRLSYDYLYGLVLPKAPTAAQLV